MANYLIGCDIGTSGAKAIVIEMCIRDRYCDVQNLLWSNIFSLKVFSFGIAGLYAFSTARAQRTVNIDCFCRSRGACPDAHSTTDAQVRVKEDLRLRMDGFRIAAPPAAQRAALQEYCRSYSGPVMYGKPLDVKNTTLHVNTVKGLCGL